MKRPLCCWLHQQKVIGSWAPRDSLVGQKTITFDCKKAVFTCFFIRFVQFLVKDKVIALSHKRFYLFPFCQRLCSNLSWCQHRIGLLLKMWYFVVSTPYGLNQLLGIQTKPKCSNKIEKVENAKPFLLRDVCVLLTFIANKKRNPKLQKLDRDCKWKLSLSLLSQLDQFFDQSRFDQLIKAVSENEAHASRSNSVRLCSYD